MVTNCERNRAEMLDQFLKLDRIYDNQKYIISSAEDLMQTYYPLSYLISISMDTIVTYFMNKLTLLAYQQCNLIKQYIEPGDFHRNTILLWQGICP